MNKAFKYFSIKQKLRGRSSLFLNWKKTSMKIELKPEKSFWKNNGNLTADFRPHFMDYMV